MKAITVGRAMSFAVVSVLGIYLRKMTPLTEKTGSMFGNVQQLSEVRSNFPSTENDVRVYSRPL